MMMMSVVAILLAHRDEAARELERLATLDGLTGALNRRAWVLKSEIDLASSLRYKQPLGVLMLDLDYFKQINDQHGHAGGDRALQVFVAGLRAVSRVGDLFCRYGGEEFCVLLNCADFASIMAYDERLRQWLARYSLKELGLNSLQRRHRHAHAQYRHHAEKALSVPTSPLTKPSRRGVAARLPAREMLCA